MAKDIDKLLQDAQAEAQRAVDAATAKLEPLWAKREAEHAVINAAREKIAAMQAEIKRLEAEELVPARNTLSRIAKANGAKALSDFVGGE